MKIAFRIFAYIIGATLIHLIVTSFQQWGFYAGMFDICLALLGIWGVEKILKHPRTHA